MTCLPQTIANAARAVSSARIAATDRGTRRRRYADFDTIYAVIKDLLDCFYPEREITVTTSDPRFVRPAVKAMLRRKNRLMHAGRVEEANALARLIRTVITRRDTATVASRTLFATNETLDLNHCCFICD